MSKKQHSMASFVSADTIPIKLFYHPEVSKFVPLHIQWLPTNACNLNCPQCSCANRDKSLQMSTLEALKVIKEFAARGCKAVTITGGGEPLMHPGIEDMIDAFHHYGIKIGLVTNGLKLENISTYAIEKLTWCRISSMDHRSFDSDYASMLKEVTRCNVAWAFSHVVTDSPNMKTIKRLVNFANANDFTHMRLVFNLLSPEKADASFSKIRQELKGIDSLVIYQARNSPKPCSSCLIGYVKPLIAPDFKVYLCCGVQYALKEKSLDLPDELCMGSALDLDSIYENIKPFSTKCVTCYYTAYNDILSSMYDGIEHKEFI